MYLKNTSPNVTSPTILYISITEPRYKDATKVTNETTVIKTN